MPEYEGATISLMSPERMLELSSGEIKTHLIIDPVTLRPVTGGLLCEKLFGPERRGTCGCGKFWRDYRERLVTCPECGVTITDPRVRRQRLGHIDLTVPVVHPWYKGALALLLGIPPKTFQKIVDCSTFMVLTPGKSDFEPDETISEPEYILYCRRNPEDAGFVAATGSKLINALLEDLELADMEKDLRSRKPSRRVNAQLTLVRDLLRSRVDPKWMLLKRLLVLPPDLRPVIAFEDGTVASSDVNELYARVIIRNKRLKILYEKSMVEISIISERRLLQRAVDALFDNSRTQVATNRGGKKVLKSLSGMIEKKAGSIRRNSLGKRVDFSGRSPIVVGPELKLHQCGLPYELAMEIFKPMVYGRLLRIGYAGTLRHARAMCDTSHPQALEALEYVVSEWTVMLNRAPSLHRMSIQAFDPVLISEKAIRLHPLVCSAFNADFDGDQMGVHIPVTVEAQAEARLLISSVNNILSPASGKLVMAPSQDIVLGVYYLTKDRGGLPGEGMVFADREDALMAYDCGVIDLQARIKVRIDGRIVESTAGRIIFSEVFPAVIPFDSLNKTVKKKDLAKLIEACYDKAGRQAVVSLLDEIKSMGFKFATLGGISLSSADITIPAEKRAIIEATESEVREIREQYRQGQINDTERHNKVVDRWKAAAELIGAKVMEQFGIGEEDAALTEEQKKDKKEFNSVFMMADSGARGSAEQIRQVAGMRGMMEKPTGEIVEIPIKSSLKEGLTYHEYLISCHGARKGRADGALKTAHAGHFTRRLVDLCHDVVIEEMDCGCEGGLVVSTLSEHDLTVIPIEERLAGRVTAKNVLHPLSSNVLAPPNTLITKETAAEIAEAGVTAVEVRSAVTCALRKGICARCYGLDLSTRELPEIGTPMGIIAAQSTGEPGTQLMLRTFHSGGASGGKAAKSSVESPGDGTVTFTDLRSVRDRGNRQVVISKKSRAGLRTGGSPKDIGRLPYGSTLEVEEGTAVRKGDVIARWDPHNTPIIATSQGSVLYEDVIENATILKQTDAVTGIESNVITGVTGNLVPRLTIGEREYILPAGAILTVKDASTVHPGDVIAKVVQGAAKSSDITAGLSRVLQMLEVRRLETPALLADMAGEIRLHPAKGKNVPIEIIGEGGHNHQYEVPAESQLAVFDGDLVKAGDIIVEGTIDARDVLRILGREAAAAYVINDVQKVYRSQGVDIADKHLEIILRKMLGKVRITKSGDTDFVQDEIVSAHVVEDANAATSGAKATAEPVLLSLTRAPQLSDSWLSAVSFQNTACILADAALRRRSDPLQGTKENILMGNIVPIGTGHPRYRNTFVIPPELIEEEILRQQAVDNAAEYFGFGLSDDNNPTLVPETNP